MFSCPIKKASDVNFINENSTSSFFVTEENILFLCRCNNLYAKRRKKFLENSMTVF